MRRDSLFWDSSLYGHICTFAACISPGKEEYGHNVNTLFYRYQALPAYRLLSKSFVLEYKNAQYWEWFVLVQLWVALLVHSIRAGQRLGLHMPFLLPISNYHTLLNFPKERCHGKTIFGRITQITRLCMAILHFDFFGSQPSAFWTSLHYNLKMIRRN